MTPKSVVLLYHRVGDSAGEDLQRLTVSPSNFSAQLCVMRHLADPVRIDDAASPGNRARFAVTFDDGYRDNLTVALPILRELDVPATTFVTSGFVGSTRGFWWDELEHLVAAPQPPASHVELELPSGRLRADVRTSADRRRLYAALDARLHAVPYSKITAVLDSLWEQIGGAPAPADDRLTAEQVVELDGSGLVEVGAHTRTHSLLSALSPERQRWEIEGSKSDLEDVLQHPVQSFAYPFGNAGSFTRRSESIVRRAGFRYACWNIPGRSSGRHRHLRIRRHLVRDWAAEEFETQVSEWLKA